MKAPLLTAIPLRSYLASHLSQNVWLTYGLWFIAISAVFFSVYPTCNWLTSHRSYFFPLYLDIELGIPFIPEFIWAYVSMYVLFLVPPFILNTSQLNTLGKQLVTSTLYSGLIFLLVPAKLGFPRVLPQHSPTSPLYAVIFAVDLPHNMVPALHVVFSALILSSLITASKTSSARAIWLSWLALICASTLLVHQHHVLDVLVGLFITALIRYLARNDGGSHA